MVLVTTCRRRRRGPTAARYSSGKLGQRRLHVLRPTRAAASCLLGRRRGRHDVVGVVRGAPDGRPADVAGRTSSRNAFVVMRLNHPSHGTRLVGDPGPGVPGSSTSCTRSCARRPRSLSGGRPRCRREAPVPRARPPPPMSGRDRPPSEPSAGPLEGFQGRMRPARASRSSGAVTEKGTETVISGSDGATPRSRPGRELLTDPDRNVPDEPARRAATRPGSTPSEARRPAAAARTPLEARHARSASLSPGERRAGPTRG